MGFGHFEDWGGARTWCCRNEEGRSEDGPSYDGKRSSAEASQPHQSQ